MDERDALLDDLVRAGDVRALLQPIVDLSSGETVAYEALARGPRGSDLERPDLLLGRAREAGRLQEVDALCRRRAMEAGEQARLSGAHSLFVNVEPDALQQVTTDEPPSAPRVLELTERALSLDPALLIRTVTVLRERGWAFAIDDLGVNARSLSLLPLIAPEVVKLDMSLVQRRPGPHAAMIMSAVSAHAEVTGALVLAEGIETDEHLVTARALGADLGQGWLFGRPAEPGTVTVAPGLALTTSRPTWAPSATPYEIAADARRPKTADKRLLIEVSKHLETMARRDAVSTVVLAAFQGAENLTPATLRRYGALVAEGGVVVVLAEGVDDAVALPDLHVVDLAPDDPLTGEWSVAVVSTDFAALLAARELSGTDRRFEFVLTHDRALVLEAAHSLLARLSVQQRP